MSISLGCHDLDIEPAKLNGFLSEVHRVAGGEHGKLRCDTGIVKLRPVGNGTTLSIADVQSQLAHTGFFPGGRIDGIYGYRTQSAIRLFQEYVRSVEKKHCLPDGIAGPKTAAELLRWIDSEQTADWTPQLSQWRDSSNSRDNNEYYDWLDFLKKVKSHLGRESNPALELVDTFTAKTDTKKIADWQFDKDNIHLIGIRRGEQDNSRKFDDIFVLLIKGLVFKFQGSTDPGHTKNPMGAPFLVQGQHDYNFGLHQNKYHALRPVHFGSHGVLVVRSKGDYRLTAEDLDKGVETNGTINIHWGGKGVGRAVNRWSEGCQVITGSGYENHNRDVINCSSYVGINNTEVGDRKKKKTRGAYNVLSDLIVALSSDMAEPGLVKYMLLHESDLALDDGIRDIVDGSRQAARRFMKKLR